MSIFNDFLFDLITSRGKRTSDYQYSILEHTPYLHGSETLETMYNNASTDDQRASIMLHLENFREHTTDVDSYDKLRGRIWDDFS